MAETYLSDPSLFSRIRRYVRLYLPSVYFVLDEFYDTYIATPAPLYQVSTDPALNPLAAALQKDRDQRTLVNFITGFAIILGVIAAAALLLTNPFGWGLIAGIVGSVVCVIAIPTITRHIIKVAQALRNKWNTRIKLTYVSELTDKKAEELSKKLMDSKAEQVKLADHLKAKFKAINTDPKANKKRVLTHDELTEICDGLGANVTRSLKYLIGFTEEKLNQLRGVLGFIKYPTVLELNDTKAEELSKLIEPKSKNRVKQEELARILKQEFLSAQTRDPNIKSPFLTLVELEKICQPLEKSQKKKVKKLLGFSTSLAWLRLISGGTNPHDDQNIAIHIKTRTKTTTYTIIGAIIGSVFVAVSSFVLSPIGAGFVTQVMASILGLFMGARLGQEIGEGYITHPDVNPERTFDGLKETTVNHASRWWLKRSVRHAFMAATISVSAFLGFLNSAKNILITIFSAYTIAGTASATAMAFGGRKSKFSFRSSATADPITAFTVKPEGDWTAETIDAATVFWLEYREKYIAKSNISNMFAAMGHRIFYNIRFPWEKMTAPLNNYVKEVDSYLPKNIVLKCLIGLVYYPLTLAPMIPLYVQAAVLSAAIGLPKSILEGLYHFFVPGENSYSKTHAKHIEKRMLAQTRLEEIAKGKTKLVTQAVETYVAKKIAKAGTPPAAPVPPPASFTEGVKLYVTADTFSKQQKPAFAPTPALRSMLSPIAPT